MIDQSFAEYLFEKGQNTSPFYKLCEDDEKIYYAVLGKDGFYEQREINKIPPKRKHLFYTIDSFCNFLKSPYIEGQGKEGIVFVNNEQVLAELDYRHCPQELALLPLSRAPEYTALEKLINGVTQKQLWRLLVTDLHDCFSPQLLLAIGGIKISTQNLAQTVVNELGVMKNEISNDITIQFSDGKSIQTTTIEKEWTWTGAIYEGSNVTIEIQCRLELFVSEEKKCIVFQFHPYQLERRKQEFLTRFTAELRQNLPVNFPAFEGTY